MTDTLRSLLVTVVAWLIVQLPTVARACSVCTAGRDEENQTAFLLSTIFMSLLPLMAIGTLVFILWRRFQKLEAAASMTAPSTPMSTSTANEPEVLAEG